ncbi:NADH:flavin oxidoreductase/NADH oxidase [Sphingobacterium faecale]|uniref:NADH:flavin oxidoreductase/NADH oxidase n=1 Tax=Sphingobacterium faecale TaxID=2803775 RepID=A0ABS1R400_9SPHI|nr:NADH:flavin oxidoreductase/NADH oxidase [Sphingobacterium faecale]MBL1409274.1 NADH:flavin oxidoreductase/NADH oxidase [Sphingobacterium faecale]
MSLLFSPLALKNQTLSNRLVVSPMCQYSAVDGFANHWHLVHLGQFAAGKAALVIQEATAVSPEGRISHGDLGLWKDEQMLSFRDIVNFVHDQGSLIGIQLAHAGRKASTDKPWISRAQIAPDQKNGWQTVAPSPIPYHPQETQPRMLSKSQIQELVHAFRSAAVRAVEIGYDVIELHAAHGYLIHQFLSPLTNQRTDEYGGSFENRTRFLLEIISAVLPVVENRSLWIRISATDWADGGWDVLESIKLVEVVKTMGVEVVDVSSGGAVRHQQIMVKENYQVPFAQRIKEETGLLTGTVGLIKSAEVADRIIEQKKADIILIGRGFLQNPHLVLQFAHDLHVDIPWLPQYVRGRETF